MTLIVDPWHWLEDDGTLPEKHPQLRRPLLRIARYVEYGASLQPGGLRRTLVECEKRPGRKPCLGLMVVHKLEDGRLQADCPACGNPEMLISNWQTTPWAHGMQEPEPAGYEVPLN